MFIYRHFQKFKDASLEFPVFLTGFACGIGCIDVPQMFNGKIPKPVHSMEEEDWIIINSFSFGF